jgi:hypothetical protein
MGWLSAKVVDRILRVPEPVKKRNYLSAVLIACEMEGKASLVKKIRSVLQSLRTKIKEKATSQKYTQAQKAKALEWPNLQKRFRAWGRRLPAWKKENWVPLQRYVVASAYLLRAPLRLDWYNVTYKGSSVNFLDGKKLVLSEFKTKKKFGPVRLDLGTALHRVLQKWKKVRNSMGDNQGFLFLTVRGKPFSRNAFSKYLSSIIKEITNKQSSVSFLRKSYISHVFKDDTPLKKRMKIANDLLHSVETQQLYYRKV